MEIGWGGGFAAICSSLARRALGFVLLATAPLIASAATTSTVFDVQRPGGFIRVLLLVPERPVATLIMLTGGDGVLGLTSDGSATALRYSTNPPSRNTQRFLDLGYAVAHVDAISGSDGLFLVDRLTQQHFRDLEAVVQEIRSRVGAPPWLVGYSAGTISATNLAVNLPGSPAPGIILLAPVTAGEASILPMDLASIRRPAFVLTHPLDSCSTTPPANGPLVLDLMASAPLKQHVALGGGVNDFPGCDARGHHGWTGLDAELVAQIASWVAAGASLLSPPNYQALWWRSPAGSESGWGLNITHQGDTLFATWFTYDIDGGGMWLVMPAGRKVADKRYAGELYRTTGPAFNATPFDPAQVAVTPAGSATLEFHDAGNGTFTYVVGGITQSKAITKQVYSTPVPECLAGGPAGASPNYQDLWWKAPAGSESGWGLNIAHQGDTLFATWFTYDTNGRGMWLVMSAGRRIAERRYTGELYRTTGPAFNAVPFDPGRVIVTQVGSATFEFSDANNALFSYTVNGISQSKPITRQAFATPATVCR